MTALELPLSITAFNEFFLTGPNCIACFVAESFAGAALGFQSLTRNTKLPEAWADIATFTQRQPRTPGVGTALFKTTADFARRSGLIAINATIRADNQSGIPYYERWVSGLTAWLKAWLSEAACRLIVYRSSIVFSRKPQPN